MILGGESGKDESCSVDVVKVPLLDEKCVSETLKVPCDCYPSKESVPKIQGDKVDDGFEEGVPSGESCVANMSIPWIELAPVGEIRLAGKSSLLGQKWSNLFSSKLKGKGVAFESMSSTNEEGVFSFSVLDSLVDKNIAIIDFSLVGKVLGP